jgi:GMP synthase (glutamine-hydrolysing)
MGSDGAPRLLIVDAYPRDARERLQAAGGRIAGELFRSVVARLLPEARCDVLFAADADGDLPPGTALAAYDGMLWSGSPLTVHREDDPRVRRQIELARRAYDAGVAAYGSCWGMQVAAVAAGGVCVRHPFGRELGVVRKIALTPEGRAHPFFAGKPPVFDSLGIHEDEVTHLPADALVLASNAHTRVQAVAIGHGDGSFWGVQYHPEFDLRELAGIIRMRAALLAAEGFFVDEEGAAAHARTLEALHQDPECRDLAWALGIDADVLNDDLRLREIGNWLRRLVLPALRR